MSRYAPPVTVRTEHLPYLQPRSFNKDQFKYGSDPYSIWKTITDGAGQMGAQKWLTPEERYAVVQYIREEIVKDPNPESYFEVTDNYLGQLPKPTVSQEQLEEMIRGRALSGSQKYGQLYFSENLGDYGKALYSQVKEHANSALTIKLGNDVHLSYNVHRMSTSAAWKGGFDLSKSKYQLYRGEERPIVEGSELPGMHRMHWGFTGRYRQLNALVSDRTPFPSEWLH